MIESYTTLISAMGALALLQIIQLIVADVMGILAKHTPGTPVDADHNNPLFRASRVVANTNESIAIFILASAFCLLVNASPSVSGTAAWAYLIARVVYAFCYYANLRMLRSIVFAFSLLALVAMVITGVCGYLAL